MTQQQHEMRPALTRPKKKQRKYRTMRAKVLRFLLQPFRKSAESVATVTVSTMAFDLLPFEVMNPPSPILESRLTPAL